MSTQTLVNQDEIVVLSAIPLRDDSSLLKSPTEFSKEDALLEKACPPALPLVELPPLGRDAYLSLVGCFLIIFCIFGSGYIAPAFLSYYATVLLPTYPVSTLSWIANLAWLFELLLSFPAGILYDRGYARIAIAVSSCTFCFFLFMMSLSTQYYQLFLTQGVGLGLSLAGLYLPSYAVVASHFAGRKSATLALGLAMSGGTVAGVCLPILVNRLIPRLGFPWAVRVYAFLNVGCLLVANLIIRPIDPRLTPVDPTLKRATIKDLCKDLDYVLIVISGCLIVFSALTPMQYCQLWAIFGTDASPVLSSYFVSILNAAGLLALFITYAAGHVGLFNVSSVTMAVIGMLCFVWSQASSTGGALVFIIAYGFVFSATFPLLAAMLGATANNPKDYGFRSGCGWTLLSFFICAGVPCLSAIVGGHNGARHHFDYAGWTAGSLLLVAATLLTFVRFRMAKKKKTWKV